MNFCWWWDACVHIVVKLNFFVKMNKVCCMWFLIEKEKHVDLERTNYPCDLWAKIDQYAFQLIFFVCILMIMWFFRTCFIPYWDYIDTYIDVKRIEALGFVHQSQKANLYYAYIL